MDQHLLELEWAVYVVALHFSLSNWRPVCGGAGCGWKESKECFHSVATLVLKPVVVNVEISRKYQIYQKKLTHS